MTFLITYAIFALTTAITSLLELLAPVIHKQESVHAVDNKFILYATFFVIATLTAPFVFFSCIIPTLGDKFRNGLQDGLFSKD